MEGDDWKKIMLFLHENGQGKKHFKQEKLGRQKYKPMAKPHMILYFYYVFIYIKLLQTGEILMDIL